MDENKENNVISFINMKGGVGKTTLTVNIGYTMYKKFNKKVLIVDMDPQFNATQLLMTKFKDLDQYKDLRKTDKTIAYLLQKNPSSMFSNKKEEFNVSDFIVNLEGDDSEGLSLIPGDLQLTTFESSVRGSEKYLDKSLKKIIKNYDIILIDTPATYSIYSQASLLASDYYIVPIAPDAFSFLGYDLLQNKLKGDPVLEDNKPKDLGIISTLYNKNKIKRASIDKDFSRNNYYKFENKLIENENIRTGNIANLMYDMSGTKDNIISLTEEVLSKINNN